MIVVYGTDESKEQFGPVRSLTCSQCKSTNEWKVHKATDWFTLYFLPLIPFNKLYIQCCNCNHVEIIAKNEYKIYREMLKLSQEIGGNEPNDSQQSAFNILEEKLTVLNNKKLAKIEEDISHHSKVISEMTDEELVYRFHFRVGYTAAFLTGVEREIEKRQIQK